jgi:two-component system, OmpR family, sensor histidine kinase CiaH
MMNYLKQFEGWAINLKRNVFLRARLALTLYYVLIMGVIMCVFSLLLYYSLVSNLSDSLQDKFSTQEQQEEVFLQTSDNFQYVIFLGDAGALLIIAILSYILAGYTLRPIQRALDDQKQFSADASHELRTPLAIIQSESEVIMRDLNASDNDYKKVVGSTLEEVERMKKIVNDLLIVARSEQQADAYTETIDLSSVVRESIAKVKTVAQVRGILLSTDIGDHLYFIGNHNLIEHAILNVLQNSLDYTPEGNSIEVKTFDKDGLGIVKIIDTGIGISPNDLPHVLKRFYKADNSRNRKSSGSGLGLAIVDRVIKDHIGSIDISSIINEGTTVTIKIPLR